MARAPMLAMDFLGLGKMPYGMGNEVVGEDDRPGLVKQTASFPAKGFWPAYVDGLGTPGEFPTARGTSEQNINSAGRQNQQPKPKEAVPSVGSRGEETRGDRSSGKPSASAEKTPLDKPLEELTDEDIMQLTREDCRRYLKEKGMRRPSWNKSQAIQQVLSLKGLFGSKCDEERKSGPTSGSKKSSAESTTPEPSPLQQVAPSHRQQAVPHKMQQASPFQTSQALSSNAQQALPFHLQQASPSQGHQALPFHLQQASPSQGQQALPFQNVITARMQEPCTTSGRALDRHGSMDLQLAKQLNQSQTGQFGEDGNGAPLVAPQLTGFGSPLPSFLRFSRSLPASVCPPDSVLSMAVQQHVEGRLPAQATYPQCVQAVGAGTSTAAGKQPTAQLTIFYSGMVNVYDDVPADKAQAIMLLAGSGNSWSTTHSLVSNPSVTATATTTPANTEGILAVPYTTSNVHGPLVPAGTPIIPSASKQQTPSATQSEHPPSRKASLQRFLEKRKDRGRMKAPYPTSRKIAGDSLPHMDAMSSMKIYGRSYSLSSLPHTLTFSAPGQMSTQSSGSETSSLTRPPHTPRQTSSNEHGTSAGKRPSDKEGGEDKPCSSEMELSSPSQQNSG